MSFRREVATAFALTPALTIVVVGVLALVLVTQGRRWSWLPLAVAAMFMNTGITLTDGLDRWSPGIGRGFAVLAVVVAVLPVWWATRGRIVVRRPVPRAVAVAAALAVAVPSVIAYVGPNNSNVPEPLAALAGFSYAVLVTASAVPRRWLPLAWVLPVLALPPVGWAVGDRIYQAGPGEESTGLLVALAVLFVAGLLGAAPVPLRWRVIGFAALVLGIGPVRDAWFDTVTSTGPTPPSYVGPMLLTLAIIAVGAAVPLAGPRVLEGWRALVRRGPTLSLPHPSEAPV